MMNLSESSRRYLAPSFLYSPSVSSPASSTLGLDRFTGLGAAGSPSGPPPPAAAAGPFMIQAPIEPRNIAMYLPMFYPACTAGGITSCGLTHMAVTPLDLVKCNMQIDPAKYKSISSGFGILL